MNNKQEEIFIEISAWLIIITIVILMFKLWQI